MAFFTRNSFFHRAESQVVIDELEKRVTRLERENADLEQTALNASTDAERVRAELNAAKKGAKQLRKVITEQTAQHNDAIRQQRHDFTLQITELTAKVVGLTAQRDTAQANFEWARLMFNKGEQERAILTARIIERPVQPFSIEREAAPPPPTDGTAGAAGQRPNGVDRPNPLGSATETAIGGLAGRFGVDFEDVGDDTARQLGIDHEDA